MKRPNFFIVGAPKCGTTAMSNYLRQHPDIFIPQRKEPNFFGRDLHPSYDYVVRDESSYFALFSEANREKRLGEASVWYLCSERAAEEIYEFCPNARILVMLRDPVEMMYSLHSQLLYVGDEDIPDFAAALAAEPDRKQGKRLPRGTPLPEALFYREMACYGEQLKRYFQVFGREQVHVILFDDFAQGTAGVYCEACRFLEVDPEFEPEIRVINANRKIHSHGLHRFLIHPPELIARFVRRHVPWGLRRWVVARLLEANVRSQPRPPLDTDFKRRLQKEIADEVQRVADLIGRDLSMWQDKPAIRGDH